LDANAEVWTPVELAWAAGFLDGEGNFRVQSTSRTRGSLSNARLVLWASACQTVEEPLLRLQRLFGGSVVARTPTLTQLGVKPLWEWRVSGLERVQAAIVAMWPYFSVKRQQASASIAQYVQDRAGLPPRRRTTPGELAHIVQLATTTSMTEREIAAEVGRPPTTVHQTLKRMGVRT
jgi:hypothetical protein